ncbi:polyprenol reductase 2 isoform X2 [Amborella trichopoda]|uniref:polyprenol reductase 2 isoform X2 n=1 Tax=Amborella trichopoda TaxID=13333 RepID=UPI0005D3DD7D|nr:polyprenol reductase 2 isoform X2 [Amborella trichopoda]|eukprot:XP_011627227.1 polyprenol reductase 2 isoform X2 [Amborella trichopoda]
MAFYNIREILSTVIFSFSVEEWSWLLVMVLRAAWIAGTLPILLSFIPFSSFVRIRNVVLGFAKRGKLLQSSSQRFTVPQNFFLHFYLVAVVWTAALLVCTWSYAHDMTVSMASEALHFSTVASHLTGGSHIFSFDKSRSSHPELSYQIWTVVFLLLMMEAQVLRRFYESLYVFNYSSSARMRILGYLTGLFFYIAAPLSLCISYAPEVIRYVTQQAANYIVKGRTYMPDVKIDWLEYIKPFVHLGLFQWIGAGIFIWGWTRQFRCHTILGSLRTQSEDDEYKIPHGDWFEFVSCAHYLAEIVSNLTLAALETHNWYLRKFDDYPRTRYAIIPRIV